MLFLKIEMELNKLKNKKILILGFAREGKDNLLFLRNLFPEKVIGIGDRLELKGLDKEAQKLLKSDKKIKLHLGRNYLKALKEYDLVLKSPGIPSSSKEFKRIKITSQTDIFLENCPGKVIGITGTKGKSTTASLIYEILKEAGLKTHLVGNIGKPVLSSLLKAKEDNIYVYEMSSHQLANVEKSPQIAVFLNLYPEHLDYYRDFKEYAQAKAKITKYQSKEDYLVFNNKDEKVKEVIKDSKAKKIDFNLIKLERIINPQKIPLKGNFNLQNIKAALAVGKLFNIPDRVSAKAVREFKPLDHRLELVGTFNGIKFYNDALATIPEATLAALDALGEDVQTIMLGGFERNLDFTKLAKGVLGSKIKTVILFPTTGEKIWQTIKKEARDKKELPESFFVDNMKKAVNLAYQHTDRGKICLLSTASSSFSIFKDYKEKGNLFKRYIKELSHDKKT